MSVDIKELQELIEEEKSAAEKVKQAKEEAQKILQAARDKAESIIQAVDTDPRWDDLRKARVEEIKTRKLDMDEEFKRKAALLDEDAKQNFEKAVALVVKESMKVET
jgi:vacuolar-type H+-ATPase subunit H